MLFVVKSYKAKKSATMVQTILYVWLVLSFCVMERQFTEFRFLSGQYQKKKKERKKGTTETNTNIKHQRISLRKLDKAAFFLKSQGMAKASKKLPDILFFYHDNIAEQIILDRLETAERRLHVTRHIVSSVERKKKQKTHWLTFIIQTGSRSSHKVIISGKIKLISDFSPFCYDTSVLNLF